LNNPFIINLLINMLIMKLKLEKIKIFIDITAKIIQKHRKIFKKKKHFDLFGSIKAK